LTEENPSGKPKSEETDFTSGKTICPYCWHRFGNEDTLFIASHPDLLGDPVMGEDQPRRFLPSRFTPEGQALDAGGVVCPDLACPNCHMRLPGDILAFAPLFMSVVGSPGSGKSYFLASATWTLRTTLPSKFGIQFMDVDAVTNQWLNAYEEKLFLQADRNAYQVIVKTEDNISASVYRNVTLHNMRVMLPMPCLFTIKTGEHCAPTGRPSDMTLVLYDNAGEHFQAGRDRADEPVTKHLVHAEGILFLFDPTEDPRFGPVLQNLNTEGAPPSFARQDVLLIEMITRIRKHLGLRAGQRLKKTMMIGISKADRLGDLFPLDESPWRKVPGSSTFRLDLEMIGCVSDKARRLMLTYAPEIVTTVESIAETVVYLPNSALGHDPAQHGVRPTDITPRWVEVPVLYTLARLGYIPTT
jgi:hypothetical protein